MDCIARGNANTSALGSTFNIGFQQRIAVAERASGTLTAWNVHMFTRRRNNQTASEIVTGETETPLPELLKQIWKL